MCNLAILLLLYCLCRSPNNAGIKFNGKEMKMVTAGNQFCVWEIQP